MAPNSELSLRDRHDAVMGDGAPMFYEEPMQLARGEGVWLFDVDGNRYLDAYNNVPCVGHGNPRVVDAIQRQMTTLNVHSRYLHENVIRYAERIASLHHPGLESLVVVCTGSEANEIALNIARDTTGKKGIIGTSAAYHGNTPEVAKLTRLAVGAERAGVRSISPPELYRPVEPGLSEAELCDRSLAKLRRQIDALEESGEGFAGVLFCSIMANEGLPDVPAGFFGRMTDVVHAAGGLVIADEVQAGFARSGTLWGYETTNFEPDVAVMGKPMGNGIPVAAVIASHELVSEFRSRHRYFNTFAASPVQAAAGGAVLDEIEERGLVEQVARVGTRLKAGLVELQADRPVMGDVRGPGLFIAIDWVKAGTTDPDPSGAASVVEAMRQRGVLMGRAGEHGNVLKVRPPIVFDNDNADTLLAAFADATDQTSGR